MTLSRHLAMVRNPASTERARRISEDALFTSLSAGCHPEQRLQVAQNLFGNIDIGYNSLLARHVEATRDEVLDIDRHELVEQGKKLWPSLWNRRVGSR